jgi:hypothetical protein
MNYSNLSTDLEEFSYQNKHPRQDGGDYRNKKDDPEFRYGYEIYGNGADFDYGSKGKKRPGDGFSVGFDGLGNEAGDGDGYSNLTKDGDGYGDGFGYAYWGSWDTLV